VWGAALGVTRSPPDEPPPPPSLAHDLRRDGPSSPSPSVFRAYPSKDHAGIVLFRPPAPGRGTTLLFVRRHLASIFERELKLHSSVADAVVVRVPDERFGETIVAIVEPEPGAVVDESTLIAHSWAHLAPCKAPKRVIVVPSIGRAENGKVDYRRHRAKAMARFGS
jgi:AMP-binding enzyme C-terminal domain